MVNVNPETRSKEWTKEVINAANEKYKNSNDIAPVVIISYKRGGNASSIKLLKNSGIKVYLFVYDDDYENYKDAVESSDNIEAVLCPSSQFRGAAKKRDYVQETMYNKGFEDYFILDDDISALFYTEIGQTKAGKYKAQKVQIDPKTFFSTWYYVIHDLADYEITLGGIIAEFASWGQNLYKLPVTDRTGRICQIMYINALKFEEHRIRYIEEKSWDDFDVMLQVLDKGLGLSQIRWLTYAGDTMNPNNSVASGGDYTWTKKSMRLYQKWGDNVGFKADKGQLNTTINWAKIKKDLKILGHLNVTYKEEWLSYFNLEHSEDGGYKDKYLDASVDNPYNLEYIKFTELWRPEIEKWLEKHPQKVKKEKKLKTDKVEAQTIVANSSDSSVDTTEAIEYIKDIAKDLSRIDKEDAEKQFGTTSTLSDLSKSNIEEIKTPDVMISGLDETTSLDSEVFDSFANGGDVNDL